MGRMVAACGSLSNPSTRPRRAASCLHLSPTPCNAQVRIYVWNLRSINVKLLPTQS